MIIVVHSLTQLLPRLSLTQIHLLLRALLQMPEDFSFLDFLWLMLFVKVSSINYNLLIPDRADDRVHIHELLFVRFDLLQIEWILKCLCEFFVASNIEVCNPIEVSSCALKVPWSITDMCRGFVVLSSCQ